MRDALLWAIPALAAGLFLRGLLLSYSPYAYWGSDSRSFMGFTHGVLTDFYFSINEKRRYLYPIMLLPVSLLPGGTLRWLGGIQAFLGLLTILPVAYMARRVFAAWRWFIIPVTLLYACLPVYIWYEHELIADTITFDCIVWIMAGWMAWVCQRDPARARSLWWWFLVPLAILLLTKPSGRMLWPGIVIALLVAASWRTLRWPQWLSLAALFLASLTVGAEKQSSWLLYTTVFPLTRLDTPLHAEYKAEIRPLVEKKMAHLSLYEEEDSEVHDFLRSPEDHPEYPRWQALASKGKKLDQLYKDLAREAILSRPHLFLLIAIQRLAGSCNLSDFKTERFKADYFAVRFKDQLAGGRNNEDMLRIAFGLPRNAPLPDYEEFRKRISPRPDSPAAAWLMAFADAYQDAGTLLQRPNGSQSTLAECRPTPLFWWLALALLLSLFPPWLKPLGVWSVTIGGYLVAVYLVGIEHQRYFAFAWPLLIFLLPLPLDAVVRVIRARRAAAPLPPGPVIQS